MILKTVCYKKDNMRTFVILQAKQKYIPTFVPNVFITYFTTKSVLLGRKYAELI